MLILYCSFSLSSIPTFNAIEQSKSRSWCLQHPIRLSSIHIDWEFDLFRINVKWEPRYSDCDSPLLEWSALNRTWTYSVFQIYERSLLCTFYAICQSLVKEGSATERTFSLLALFLREMDWKFWLLLLIDWDWWLTLITTIELLNGCSDIIGWFCYDGYVVGLIALLSLLRSWYKEMLVCDRASYIQADWSSINPSWWLMAKQIFVSTNLIWLMGNEQRAS